VTPRYLAAASAALATTGGFAMSNLAHTAPANADTYSQPSQADYNAWFWAAEARLDPTTQNQVNNFLTLNYDRKLHGLSYWGDSPPAADEASVSEYLNAVHQAQVWYDAVHQAQVAQWYQGVLNGESTRSSAPAGPAYASSSTSSLQGVWACIRQHESGGNYAENTGNGYYGAYQFALGTWQGLGYSGLPSNASPATQDAAAQRLQAESGWGSWPVSSRECGV
jgi:hypothetical protein